MKVIKTNWINVVGVFIVVFGYAIILNLYDTEISRDLFQSMFAALILVFGYGIIFWAVLLISLIVFDLLFIMRSQDSLRAKLLIEWLVISSPFVYWTIKYHEWIFIAAVIAFLITQLLREKAISKE